MNIELTLDNFNLDLSLLTKKSLAHSSDSIVRIVDEIEDEIITDKFLILKNNIGEKLYNKLSSEQKTFIVSVSGTINLGKTVDIDAIYKDIKEIEYE